MKMRKWLIGMLLAFIAFFVWVPLWLLISGSLKIRKVLLFLL